MRSADYLKRSEVVRTIADWIEPDRYIDENTRAASIEARAQLLRVAARYEDLAVLWRQIEHVMTDQEIAASGLLDDTLDKLGEDEEFPELEDFSINNAGLGAGEMAEDDSTGKVDPRLAATIVGSYVAKNSIAADQLAGLIALVHRTLSGLGSATAAPPAARSAPAVPIRRSVQPDHVVCLDCGFRAKTLRRHLRVAHGLDPAAYRARWQLPSQHPLTAPDYSAQRSTMAKELGLGRKPVAAATPAPRRHGRPRQAPAP